MMRPRGPPCPAVLFGGRALDHPRAVRARAARRALQKARRGTWAGGGEQVAPARATALAGEAAVLARQRRQASI